MHHLGSFLAVCSNLRPELVIFSSLLKILCFYPDFFSVGVSRWKRGEKVNRRIHTLGFSGGGGGVPHILVFFSFIMTVTIAVFIVLGAAGEG